MTWRNIQFVQRPPLGPRLVWIHRGMISMDDIFVERVLKIALGWQAKKARTICFIIAKQQRWLSGTIEAETANPGVFDFDHAILCREARLGAMEIPRPDVAETKLRQQDKFGRFRAAIVHGDEHENLIRRGFGVFYKDVEITVFIEDARVQQLKFRLVRATSAIFIYQPRVGNLTLRIFVEHLEVGMRRQSIEVIINLFYVLPVITLV